MKLLLGLLLLALFGLVHNLPVQTNQEQTADESVARQQRQAGHHHDSVDFGAHTGDHGSFGWYADFPVHTHK